MFTGCKFPMVMHKCIKAEMSLMTPTVQWPLQYKDKDKDKDKDKVTKRPHMCYIFSCPEQLNRWPCPSVPCLVGRAPLTIREFTTLQSDPGDLWHLRHLWQFLLTISDENFWWQFFADNLRWQLLMTIFNNNFSWQFLMNIFDDYFLWQFLMTIFDDNFCWLF